MTESDTRYEREWIAEEVDCCLSYSAHLIARYLAEECKEGNDTRGEKS